MGKIHFIEDGEVISFGNIKVHVIGYNGKRSDWYAFLFESKGKKVLYAPCDTIEFKRYGSFSNIDVLIHEIGIFSSDKVKSELSFEDMIKRFEKIRPKEVILTHLEEVELKRWGLSYLDKMKKKYAHIPLVFAYDGLEVPL